MQQTVTFSNGAQSQPNHPYSQVLCDITDMENQGQQLNH